MVMFESIDMSAYPVLETFYMTAFPVHEFPVEPGHFLYPFSHFFAFYPSRRVDMKFGLQRG